MRSDKPQKLIVCTLVVFAFSACASFRGGDRVRAPWPPPFGERRSIAVTVAMDVTVDGVSHPVSPTQLGKARSHATRVYVESGLFSSVGSDVGADAGPAPADLVVDIRVTSATKPIFGSTVLTFVTAFAIPSAYETTLTSTSTFRNGRGETLGTVAETQTTSTYEHVLLLPVSIFAFPIPVYWRAFDDLHRLTLQDARAGGVL